MARRAWWVLAAVTLVASGVSGPGSDDDGSVAAEKFGRGGAGILSSAVFADGLIELPEDVTRVERGMTVDFLPFNEMMR